MGRVWLFFKKIIVVFFLLVSMVLNSAFADDVFKIKDIKIDTSASVIFLNTIGTYPTSITDNIKFYKLPQEHKVYFDINSSVLICKKQDLYLSTGVIKQVKLSQFTTNPHVVRVVLNFSDNYDIENLKIGNINNQLVIMTNGLSELSPSFYQNTYRDKVKLAEDYYNPLNIQIENIVSQPVIINTSSSYSQKELNQVQQAFGNSNASNIKSLVKSPLNDNIHLRSKYYINSISVKNKGFLISGYGAPTIQKPFLLSNPTRLVFDFVNSNFDNSYHNQEILLSESNPNGDKIKIGRFDSNVTRMVITSENAKQYLPIFSSDNQSVLLINPENISSDILVKEKTNILQYKCQKNMSTDDLTLTFDNPVVWGIKRNADNLYLYFFNAARYNEQAFKSIVDNTAFGNAELALLKNIGIRFSLPVMADNEINTFISADGKRIRVRVSGLKSSKSKSKETVATKLKGQIIVLDPGHGGTDYGAIRDGINEKDINLEVSKRVEDILRRKGYKVLLTRDNDTYVSLEDRCVISESSNPLIFVSIHVNSCMGTEPKGIETHYFHDNSVELANVLHSKMSKSIKTTDRGLFKSKFYVINHTSVPAVLLEIGFLSNDEERAELVTTKRKQATAQAIAEGIIEYINHHK